MDKTRTRLLISVLWISGFVLLAIAPLPWLLLGERPPGTVFAWDFAVGLGFAAATLLLLMSLLIARFRRLSAPFGIDIIYYFHRQVALLIALLLLAHVSTLLWVEPLLVYELLWLEWKITSGLLAVIFIVAIVITAWLRKRCLIEYENWRRFHAFAAIAAVSFSLGHILSVDYYSAYQATLWWLLICGWLILTLYVRLLKPVRQTTRPYVVESIKKKAGNSWALTVLAKEHEGFAFTAGQFGWLTSGHSPFALAEHPFSFSSSASECPKLEFTIKQLGDFTATIGKLRPGDKVYVDGPYGSFTADQYDAPGYGFIAGGIGIAPVISMLRTMADRGDRRPVKLIYANRSAASIIYRQELDELSQRLNLTVVHVLGEADPDSHCETGRVDHELLEHCLSPMQLQWHYFICGPAPMMKIAERSLQKQGVAYSHIHSEIFNLI